MSDAFVFHPELFEVRSAVIERLSDAGFDWLTHYGAVDLVHDTFGVEVTGIHHEGDATAIAELVTGMFPAWEHHHTFYEGHNAGEIGWKVEVSRHPPDDREDWKHR